MQVRCRCREDGRELGREIAEAVQQLLVSMRVLSGWLVCRSYLSQVDVMGATEADMGEFLWRANILRMRPHDAPHDAFVFSQNNNVVKGTL